VPVVPAAGLPDRTPVEESKDTPDGSAPDSATAGTGYPLAFTVKVLLTPSEKVAAALDVIAGP
jgi:hypothetical protein